MGQNAGIQMAGGGHRRRCDTVGAFFKNNKDHRGALKSNRDRPGEDFWRSSEGKFIGDKDEDGYLLQIFTKSLQTRPTFFVN